MADYYPLIVRALDGLSDRSPQMRRAVYERARSALTQQLQSLNPPLPTAEITRERLALDDAIERVEAECALKEAVTPPRQPEPPQRAAPQSPNDLPKTVPVRPPLRPAAPPPGAADANELFDDAEAPPQRERPRIDTITQIGRDPGRRRVIVLAAALLAVVALIGVVAWFLRVQPSEIESGPGLAERPQTAEGDNKITERVTGERAPGTPAGPAGPSGGAARPDVAVAQRAILYEENQADPQNPKATPGRALWRLDALNPGQGQPLETVVRANVDVPGAGLSVTMSIRRNNDSTLPASHVVELTFATSDDPQRIVRDVGLLQFKAEEAVRGTPVAGLPVPVKDNVFLIGLSNLPGDIERNRELMLRRNWIDLPIRFASGQRAILSFEKGVSGDQVLNDAFRMWQ